MKMALDALEKIEMGGDPRWASDVTPALHARLAQPEPEPVAWMYEYGTDHGDAVNQIFWHKNLRLEKPTGLVRNVVPLYTAPPQREWQGLTDEEIKEIVGPWGDQPIKGYTRKLFDQIEAKLKEKNT
jgi:hypothetical protein